MTVNINMCEEEKRVGGFWTIKDRKSRSLFMLELTVCWIQGGEEKYKKW